LPGPRLIVLPRSLLSWRDEQAGRARGSRPRGGLRRHRHPGTYEVILPAASDDQEKMAFQLAGDQLIVREWDRRVWGEKGPGVLTRVFR
jgi:hypothetical protein